MVGELAAASLQAQEPGYDHGSLLAGNGIVGPEGAVGIAGYVTGILGCRHFGKEPGRGRNVRKHLFPTFSFDAEGPVGKGGKFRPGHRLVGAKGTVGIPTSQAFLQPGFNLLLGPMPFHILEGSGKGRGGKEAQDHNCNQ